MPSRRAFLRAAGCPTNHFRDEVLEASGRHLVVSFVDCRIRVQTGVGHDPIDQVINNSRNAVDTAEALIERGLRLLLG